ncbi:hypothetical protein ACH5RR_018705 [Cinchona calisaya]|uniref:Reverse transcriptase domain-containing protein n=1 Tax=Cinchona calisaya TaxID=153742 RepID=A0ABD2ZNW3_9GENT
MKVYDTLIWHLLFNVMQVMGFPERYIGWVKRCVTAAYFSVNLNGSLVGYFRNERGLRLGDPISFYLFLLALEVYTALFSWNIARTSFDFHPRCKALDLSHLSFADDHFIITAATEKSFQVIKDTLEEFGNLSGLQPSYQKSVQCILLVLKKEKKMDCVT